MFSLFADRSNSLAAATDASSTDAFSSGSTPPTTVADSASQHSQGSASKEDDAVMTDNAIEEQLRADAPANAEERRPRRSRLSAPIYNLSRLSGTDGHGKRRANGDLVADRRRRTISGDTLIGSFDLRSPSGKVKELEMDLNWSPRSLSSPRTRRQARESPRALRVSNRNITKPGISSFTSKLTKITKRGKKAVAKGVSRISRELLRLQDTKEFSHLDEKPVRHTVWSNGKFVDPNEVKAPPPPKTKTEKIEEEDEKEKEEEAPVTPKERGPKKYLDMGLYSGQPLPADLAKGLTIAEKKKLAMHPELSAKRAVNKTMPPPLYTGFRMLIAGRDFKLPFATCHPLPPGQLKPDEWKKMTRNRFVGESKEYWRKSPHYTDESKCVCKKEDGCGDNCQNRIMLYECDENNCTVGKEFCNNRAFANLTTRKMKGGKYRVGVEVIKTSDRGHGVRSNRCFEPQQIIMEYAGEIITDAECERRMNEEYKNNECYYLMSFDQNMIIDATTGSIARFVNHSCDPNCRMIKWIVSGQPRMALFAGDKPIQTGDELTYDYNFDPFSAKNVQKCLCGSPNCRGVLGPRPKEVRAPKTDLKSVVKASVKAGKRKLKEFLGDDSSATNRIKKRKIQAAKGTKGKGKLVKAAKGAAKGAATALKKGVSGMTAKKAKAATPKKPTGKKRSNASALLKKTASRNISAAMSKNGSRAKLISSRASSLTIVGMNEENIRAGRKASSSTVRKVSSSATSSPVKAKGTASQAKASPRPRKVSMKTTAKMPRRGGKP